MKSGPACAGRLLPEGDYVPPQPPPGAEEANPGTQFPFELTMHPATQQPSQVAQLGIRPQFFSMSSGRGSLP